MIKNKNIAPDAAISVTKTDLATSTTTFTNKTLTAPVLSGSVTGTYTLAGTPTITSPAINGATIGGVSTMSAGNIDGDIKRCTSDVTWATGAGSTTLANITGLTSIALVAGATYAFDVNLQTNCSTNGGISVAFKYTTATLTSIQLNATTIAAASLANARNTTTTDATKFVDNKTAAWLNVRLTGTMVVNAAGTLAVQAAQNTDHADTTTVYAGSTARFTRIA